MKSRPRKREITISHVDIVLSSGTIWRIGGDLSVVWELETLSPNGQPVVRGPLQLVDFVTLLEKEKERRDAEDQG